MGFPKSPSEDMVFGLYQALFADLRILFPDDEEQLTKDLETIISRLKSEGMPFATKILPKLGKAFDLALEVSQLSVPPEFKKSRRSPNIPAFMQCLFRRVFSPSGLLETPDISVIRCIRQVCYLVYKLELPFDPDSVSNVLETFIKVEEEIRALALPAQPFLAYARMAVGRVLKDLDPREIVPKHGPGAVATGEKLNGKWTFHRRYEALDRYYPYESYFMTSRENELPDRMEWLHSLNRQEAGNAKVVLVPKDSRGPRLISCEPLEYQYLQQGLNRELVSLLERHPLTRGHINFADQETNRCLARESSRYRHLCTLDLKDASDRVSMKLVENLFPKRLVPYFFALRSTSTTFPDGRVIPLSKYAPMGSALCFSVEALCFWAILVGVVVQETQCSLLEGAREVYVYGDDLIIPTHLFSAAVEALEKCGLKVNTQKSYKDGYFRESCGMDAYDGVEVTPTKVSTLWSGNPRDGGAFSSYAAYANDFRSKGYEELASYVFTRLRKTYGKLPFGLSTSGYPCEICSTFREALQRNISGGFLVRRHRSYQRIEVLAKTLTSVTEDSMLTGWPRLLMNLVSPSQSEDPSRVAVPKSAKIVKRWCRI